MKEHQETFVFCLVSLCGNLLPILLSLLYYTANMNIWSGWEIFYNDGQFYLYSASLLTSTAYIFYTYKVRNTDSNSILLLITCFLVLIVSIFYAWKLAGSNNDLSFIRVSSIAVFILTILLYYYSNLLQNKKIDVIAAQKKGVQEILDKL
ncbi:hypothetical protein SAMN02927921_04072 [Sinomicrobium oceani]|uniref:Uncharacterized protein n=1 Tax=Sinomicrobium oceani TaxID=1150368 RepID=A0A1K1RVF0_9FLAO|nr:hypothetical protein [Sinomicrobium oceani]SFW76123.1 hypothetical protein SAMN02927921_04072 [Sinomicrobium oceani]